jgi:hypothetical protein
MCSNTDENAGKNNENDWDELGKINLKKKRIFN